MKLLSHLFLFFTLINLFLVSPQTKAYGNGEQPEGESNQTFPEVLTQVNNGNFTQAQRCSILMNVTPPPSPQSPELVTCDDLQRLSDGGPIESYSGEQMAREKSVDGAIECKKPASYTIDYEGCKNAIKYYNAVYLADKAMGMQQAVRTNLKGQSVHQETQQKLAEGDSQGAAFDGATELQKHNKNLNREKVLTYVSAVTALTSAWRAIPGGKRALKKCLPGSESANNCQNSINVRGVRANKDAISAIQVAMARYAAKAFAAQAAMNKNEQAIATINQARQPYEEEGSDLMLERCQFNPADPACQTAGNRVKGQNFRRGEFSVGGTGTNNSFNMNPDEGVFGEMGAETNLDEETPEIADMNNPFAEEARVASDILNPAAAANVQPQGGAGGGGGLGGGGAGLGGGGASLGSDLAGENQESNQDPKIKTGKVSGTYAAAGGGGYKGVAKAREEKNPFADLLKDKGPSGGVVEDRSIASGDIDGKASGLFQKISKRYNQIHADKRIEANNLDY